MSELAHTRIYIIHSTLPSIPSIYIFLSSMGVIKDHLKCSKNNQNSIYCRFSLLLLFNNYASIVTVKKKQMSPSSLQNCRQPLTLSMVPGGLAELGEVTLSTAYLTAHEGQVLVHVPLLQASLGVQTPAQKARRCMPWGKEKCFLYY